MRIVVHDLAERTAPALMLAPLGYPIVEAVTTKDARPCVTEQEFAVILIDVRMPTTGGFDTAAFIRSRAQSTLTPRSTSS